MLSASGIALAAIVLVATGIATPAGAASPPPASASGVYGQSDFTSGSAGSGASGLNAPTAVAVDASGGVYVADSSNNRVLYFPAGSTTATRVYGQPNFTSTGAGVSASNLNDPEGLALDTSGDLYVADSNNNRVLLYRAGSTTSTVVFGQSGFFSATSGSGLNEMSDPTGLALGPNGNLYVADGGNDRVLVFASPSQATSGSSAGVVDGQGGATSASTMNLPTGVAVDAQGKIFVADSGNNRVLAFAANTPTGGLPVGVLGQPSFVASASATTSAPSSNVCALYQLTEGFVLSMAIAPDDVATDHRVLLLV